MGRRPISKAEMEKFIASMTPSASDRQLLKLIENHGGVPKDIIYRRRTGTSGYEMLSLAEHLLWLDEHIASLIVTFASTAGALAFVRSAKQLLNTWVSIRRNRRITLRAEDLSLDVRGSADVKGAVRAFEELIASEDSQRRNKGVTSKPKQPSRGKGANTKSKPKRKKVKKTKKLTPKPKRRRYRSANDRTTGTKKSGG